MRIACATLQPLTKYNQIAQLTCRISRFDSFEIRHEEPYTCGVCITTSSAENLAGQVCGTARNACLSDLVMGIPQLFEIIQQYEEVVPIAQLAEDHHKRYGRPLRIAVDEADWRFNNLTQGQVYAIRQASGEEAFQGIEKLIFYRICRLLTLNIQLIFVFDGPKRPWKRGARGQGKIDYRARDLLKEMLRYFGIPFHEAPAEAEAECARMQMLGLVDAVFSQDSDSLMFGCSLWLRDDRIAKDKDKSRSKDNTAKSKKTVRIVKAHSLKAPLSLDREGLVLFAMLVGGDYDVKGLPGCGPTIAIKAVKQGLGQSLCSCRNQRDCNAWAILLQSFLSAIPHARHIEVPPGFPEYKTLQKYYRPVVSDDSVLLGRAHLNLGNARPIQELQLLELTSSRFNIWGKLYMNWVGPVLLTRYLTSRDLSMPREVVHEIKLTKQRVKKTDQEPLSQCLERKLTFSPFGVTSLQRKDFEGERSGYWNRDAATPFDPSHRVECEIPTYWLSKLLPPDELNPPPPEPKAQNKKRKAATEAATQADMSHSPEQRNNDEESRGIAAELECISTGPKSTAKTQQGAPKTTPSAKRPRKQLSTYDMKDCIVLSDSEGDQELRLPVKRTPLTSSNPNTTPRNAAPSRTPADRSAAIHGYQGATPSPISTRISQQPSHRIPILEQDVRNDVQTLQQQQRNTVPYLQREGIAGRVDAEAPASGGLDEPLPKLDMVKIRAARLRYLDALPMRSAASTDLHQTSPAADTTTARSPEARIDYIDLTSD